MISEVAQLRSTTLAGRLGEDSLLSIVQKNYALNAVNRVSSFKSRSLKVWCIAPASFTYFTILFTFRSLWPTLSRILDRTSDSSIVTPTIPQPIEFVAQLRSFAVDRSSQRSIKTTEFNPTTVPPSLFLSHRSEPFLSFDSSCCALHNTSIYASFNPLNIRALRIASTLRKRLAYPSTCKTDQSMVLLSAILIYLLSTQQRHDRISMASHSDSPKSPPKGARKIDSMAESTRLYIMQMARVWYCFKYWIRMTWFDLLSLLLALITYILCQTYLPMWQLFVRHFPMVFNKETGDWEGPVWLDYPKVDPVGDEAFGWAFQQAFFRFAIYTFPILLLALMQFKVRDPWDFTAACLGLCKAWMTAAIVELFLQRYIGKSDLPVTVAVHFALFRLRFNTFQCPWKGSSTFKSTLRGWLQLLPNSHLQPSFVASTL